MTTSVPPAAPVPGGARTATITFTSHALDELTARQAFELIRLRVDVFVVEQACPYPDVDDLDLRAGTRHVLGHVDGRLVACARTMPPGPQAAATPARIGRVAVRASHRRGGLAAAMMRWTLAELALAHPEHDVILGAQVVVERFYRSLGFERVSPEYVEDGIPHVDMRRPADARAGRARD